MYSKTQFGEVMSGLSRGRFDQLVNEAQANKYAKGFDRWDQLVAMIYGHLSDSQSLRELEAGFNAHASHHYHLGTHSVKRSTLADANSRRSPAIFEHVCQWLMQNVHRQLRRELKELLYLLDSSPIHLKGRGFDDWATPYRSNVSQGLKLHMLYEAHSGTPVHSTLTTAQVSDIKMGREVPIEQGAVYVFDMGYYDYSWWHRIEEAGSTFVTRLKKNARFDAISAQEITEDMSMIEADEQVQACHRNMHNRTKKKNPYADKSLRRIIVKRDKGKKPLVLITNDFTRSAEEIAALYKKRWDIELFFKWIKQNLKVKKYLGRSENAVRTHIYTSLISYLLLQIYRHQQKVPLSLKLCLCQLKVGLFQQSKTEAYLDKKRRRQRECSLAKQMELLPL